jgi:hypothetical protein
LPLILGLSSIGFIFSAVIALSPTAAEIFEEDEVMTRIAQSQAARWEPPVRPDPAQPGSVFRPQRAAPEKQPLASEPRPHRPTLLVSQEHRGWAVRKNETTRSLAAALSSQGSTGHCLQAVSPL